MRNTLSIDLGQAGREASDALVGYEMGKSVRESSGLDEQEGRYRRIRILVPLGVAHADSQFFEGLLEHVVCALTPDAFRDKFSFHNEGDYKIDAPLKEALQQIRLGGAFS